MMTGLDLCDRWDMEAHELQYIMALGLQPFNKNGLPYFNSQLSDYDPGQGKLVRPMHKARAWDKIKKRCIKRHPPREFYSDDPLPPESNDWMPFTPDLADDESEADAVLLKHLRARFRFKDVRKFEREFGIRPKNPTKVAFLILDDAYDEMVNLYRNLTAYFEAKGCSGGVNSATKEQIQEVFNNHRWFYLQWTHIEDMECNGWNNLPRDYEVEFAKAILRVEGYEMRDKWVREKIREIKKTRKD